jgi:hypothetical protein
MSGASGKLALAVAVVSLGVAVYAVTQPRTVPAVVPGPDASLEVALDEFESRLSAVEAKVREEPLPTGTDPTVLDRLTSLERRLREVPEAGEVPTSSEEPKPTVEEEPDDAEVERFRKLREAVRKQEWMKGLRRRVDDVLNDLDLDLTEKRAKQLTEAWGEFQSRMQRIWEEAKQTGAAAGAAVDWKQIISDTTGRIERELTEIISEFLPAADAERIAGGLISGRK